MKKLLNLFSYCIHCWTAKDFILVNGTWVCEECGTPLQKAVL